MKRKKIMPKINPANRRVGGMAIGGETHYNPLEQADGKRRGAAGRFLARLRRAVLPLGLLLAIPFGSVAGVQAKTAGLKSPPGRVADDGQITVDANSVGFLRLIAPKQEFFVGEMVPVELQAWFRAGVELRVDGLPRLNSDAFTMNKLGDQPARSQRRIGNVPYTVFTWSTAITAVKAGDYEMSLEIPTTVTLHQRAARPRGRSAGPFGDSMLDEFFNDSFFDSFFGSTAQKQVSLSSQPMNVGILSLPKENRPASFAGAVGTFDFTAEAAPGKSTAGDPITVTLRISGVGNFDRVAIPAIEAGSTWKCYRPAMSFEASDGAGLTGTKTFRQPLVPVTSGKLEVPALEFSFFDPGKKEYVTRTIAPVTVEVAAAEQPIAAHQASATENSAPAVAPGIAEPTTGVDANPVLRTIRWQLYVGIGTGILAIVFLVRGAVRLIKRQRMFANAPERHQQAAARQALKTQMARMEAAVRARSTPEFLAAARDVFRTLLGQRWKLPPETITLAEINARMNGAADGFRFIFELADEAAYTGRIFPAAELEKWSEMVKREFGRLEQT